MTLTLVCAFRRLIQWLTSKQEVTKSWNQQLDTSNEWTDGTKKMNHIFNWLEIESVGTILKGWLFFALSVWFSHSLGLAWKNNKCHLRQKSSNVSLRRNKRLEVILDLISGPLSRSRRDQASTLRDSRWDEIISHPRQPRFHSRLWVEIKSVQRNYIRTYGYGTYIDVCTIVTTFSALAQ